MNKLRVSEQINTKPVVPVSKRVWKQVTIYPGGDVIYEVWSQILDQVWLKVWKWNQRDE